jgi:hypothetical protein
MSKQLRLQLRKQRRVLERVAADTLHNLALLKWLCSSTVLRLYLWTNACSSAAARTEWGRVVCAHSSRVIVLAHL